MGYTTDFKGYMTINPPITPAQVSYINKFSETRRMTRDTDKASQIPDPLREAVGLPIGEDGCYFIGGDGWKGKDADDSVIEYNSPPAGQPGLWCQWVISEDGSELEWDYGEKFYEYERWLEYIQEHFLTPWGSKLNGEFEWSGEDWDDIGILYASDGRIDGVSSTIYNPGPSWGN